MAQNQTTSHPAVNPWIIAVTVMFGTFMEVLDTTVVNVSLPHIAGSLSSSVEEATWVLTSYLVANAIVLPLTGWLANYFGRKRIMITAVAGFTITSFLCGIAPSLPALVIFRILQGLFGGSLQPLSQAVLLETFPPERRGTAMGFWGLGIVVAPILGPVLGGWITDSYSWRWVFYINIPVGILSVLMVRQFIFDPPYIRRGAGGVDYWGIGMLAVAISAMQISLDKGQQEDWFSSHWITALVIISVAAFAAFIYWELTADHPVVHLKVFRDRTYRTGVMLMTTLGFVLYGSIVILPILLQTLLGYPALQAGFATSPRGVGSFLAMPIAGGLTAKVDARKLLALGLFGTAVTLFQLSNLNTNAGYYDFFWPQLIQGLAMGLIWVPLTTATMAAIPKEEMGNATSIFNLTRNLGASMGIASVTTMLSRGQQTHLNVLSAHIGKFDPATQRMQQGIQSALTSRGADSFTAARQSVGAIFGMAQKQAEMLTFVDIFRLLGVIFMVMIPMLLLMRKPVKSKASLGDAH